MPHTLQPPPLSLPNGGISNPLDHDAQLPHFMHHHRNTKCTYYPTRVLTNPPPARFLLFTARPHNGRCSCLSCLTRLRLLAYTEPSTCASKVTGAGTCCVARRGQDRVTLELLDSSEPSEPLTWVVHNRGGGMEEVAAPPPPPTPSVVKQIT